MSNSTHTTLSRFHLSLLVLAMSALAVGCSHEEHADAQPDAHAHATPATTANDHEAAAQPMHDDADDADDAADEHADHAAAVALPTPPATPWASDAPLREGMRRMHQAVDALGHAEHGHLDAAQTSAAAQQIQDAANFMFANCKLAPEPDAALHGVLATLIGGATALKTNPADFAPVASMRDAVALYPRLFEDATWQADTAPAE